MSDTGAVIAVAAQSCYDIYMELVGYLAGFLTLVGYLPQAVKTLRTRHTRDLSLSTFLIIGSSALLWTAYGLHRGAPAIWVTNAVVAVCSTIIVAIKLTTERS